MSATRRAGSDDMRWGVPLRYACDLTRLGELGEHFIASQLDTEGEAFLVASMRRAYSTSRLRLHRLLSLFLSDFDVNALLGVYPVFLFSTPQALALLEAAHGGAGLSERRLLDIGAGSGDVTTRILPIVGSVDCTETSRFMARRLRRRGFTCFRGVAGEGARNDPLASSARYDIVSLLNVIDRTRRPRSLLRAVAAHLAPGGVLLLSTPLPFDPIFYDGSVTRRPEERLSIASEAWEDAVLELWRNELEPLGFAPGALTRLPYLSGGDVQQAAYVLDAVVIACRKR